jgi:hypothetical protein
MSVMIKAGILPKALVAALIGGVTGGTAGVWSLRQPAAHVNPAPSTSRAPARPAPVSTPGEPPTQPIPAHTNAVAPSSDDHSQVLQRARTLASRPDVTALIALRDDVVRRAAEHGLAESSSMKDELGELDLRLTEARLLRLKLDAEELRKADSKRPQ